jgi:predicted molibdopterin-dependent oxidoreductase YjgC
MFGEDVRGWTNLVLPGTHALEREGTMVNLEGRAQRLRKASTPPGGRDDVAWIAELAGRYGVEVALAEGLPLAEAAERASLPPRTAVAGPDAGDPVSALSPPVAPKLRLNRYRALFSGPLVERVSQLQFQRPEPVIELAPEDASRRSIASGDVVTVLANGTSVELRARINKRLVAGAARAAEEHVRDLPDLVEVRP